jgi:hypothetical protein
MYFVTPGMDDWTYIVGSYIVGCRDTTHVLTTNKRIGGRAFRGRKSLTSM